MPRILTFFVVIFLINTASTQDYIRYDLHIQKARNYLYTEADTASALQQFEIAFEYVNQPFSIHLVEYDQILCARKSTTKSPFFNFSFFSNEDKDLFSQKLCELSNPLNYTLIDNPELRFIIDNLFEKDQAIDRFAENRWELFEDVISDFRNVISKWGYPTENKIGISIDQNGSIMESKVTLLILHGVQHKDNYFINNLDKFFENGLILGSDYRVIKNLSY